MDYIPKERTHRSYIESDRGYAGIYPELYQNKNKFNN